MKEAIGKVSSVKFTSSLAEHPVCLSSEGEISMEMAKVLGKMPGKELGVPEASIVLEINMNHPIAEKLKSLYGTDNEAVKKYAKILYGEACIISGAGIDDPKEFTALITELMS